MSGPDWLLLGPTQFLLTRTFFTIVSNLRSVRTGIYGCRTNNTEPIDQPFLFLVPIGTRCRRTGKVVTD